MSLKALSITSHYFCPIFLVPFEFDIGKSTRLLKLTISQPIFCHLYKNESAAQPGHVLSMGTNDNRMEQQLVNTMARVGLPI